MFVNDNIKCEVDMICMACRKKESVIVSKPIRVIVGDAVIHTHNKTDLGICIDCLVKACKWVRAHR